MMLTLMDVVKAIINRLSYIGMPIIIFGGFDPQKCLTQCVHGFGDLFSRNKKEVIMSWGVTKHWSVSYEQATQQQRDQCQNFSLGHRFVTIPLIVANAVKNGLSKLFITFGKSPRIGLYLLKLVFNCEETSAKILVLVTIL